MNTTIQHYYPANSITALIIDMQPGYIGPYDRELQSYLKIPSFLIPAQKKTLHAVTEKDIPVITVEYNLQIDPNAGGATIQPLTDIAATGKNTVIQKTHDSAFSNPNLDKIINTTQTPYLLFMGLYASGCILATANAAIEKGFTVITAKDLIADDSGGITHPSAFRKKQIRFYTSHEDVVERIIHDT